MAAAARRIHLAQISLVRKQERAHREAERVAAEAARKMRCDQCDNVFRARLDGARGVGYRQRFCSMKGRRRWNAPAHGPLTFSCTVCFEAFESHQPNARHCSDPCRRKAGKKATGEVRRRRAAAKIRRLRPAIIERFGMRCYLCGGAIERGPEVVHPLALTLDHVFPASAGGRDVTENLRPAHRMCNEDKGERQPWLWERQAAGIWA